MAKKLIFGLNKQTLFQGSHSTLKLIIQQKYPKLSSMFQIIYFVENRKLTIILPKKTISLVRKLIQSIVNRNSL